MALAALAPLLGSLAGGSLAGAGVLSGLGIGADALGGLTASAIGSGLGTTLATGDIGKGLESGALGFGLGGLMGGLGGVTPSNVASGINSFTGSSLPVNALTPGAATAADPLGALTGTSTSGLANSMSTIAPVDLSGLSSQMANIPGAGAATTGGLNGMLSGVGGTQGLIKAGTVALPGLSMIPAAGAGTTTPTYTSPGLTPYQTRSAAPIAAGYNAGTMPEMSYFTPYSGYAAGGRIKGPDMSGMGAISPPSPDFAVPAGPVGDGSSDSVPAMVDGNQPALLSQNEHVIPADAVAHIGNGSSEAGHRELKKMVNRVRVAKTGKAAMPARINPQGMMPA